MTKSLSKSHLYTTLRGIKINAVQASKIDRALIKYKNCSNCKKHSNNNSNNYNKLNFNLSNKISNSNLNQKQFSHQSQRVCTVRARAEKLKLGNPKKLIHLIQYIQQSKLNQLYQKIKSLNPNEL